VLVDSFNIQNSFRRVLSDIQLSDFAHVELVVMNRDPNAVPPLPPPGLGLVRGFGALLDSSRRSQFLFKLYQKLDRRHIQQPNPLAQVDCADILDGCPRLDVFPITNKFVQQFSAEDVAALRSYDLDVILRFGFKILRGGVLKSARYGIWSFHHGDNSEYRGGPALFWEVVQNNPCSGVILQVLNEKLDDGMVLCKSLFSTARGIWWSQNIFNPYWGSTHFVLRKLHELHERGWDVVGRNIVSPEPGDHPRGKLYRAPTNVQMVKWLSPKVGKKLMTAPFKSPGLPTWQICIRRTSTPNLLTHHPANWADYRWIPNERGHYYADPFLIRHAGETWLFFEDYVYASRKGHISCAQIQPDLSIGRVIPCLDLSYHLSFPHVFHHDGEVFMIPESGSNNSIELYRATNFPFSWKLEKTMFHGPAVDTTTLQHDGQWYFFTGLCEPQGNCAYGGLFMAPDLVSDWTLHPSSPISSDVRFARSAGAVKSINGHLYRPVQDCSEYYGRRIHVRQIQQLTPDAYREKLAHSIEPDWEHSRKGVHTYDYSNGFEVFDSLLLREAHQ
jgi:hypothetical protein